MPKAVGSALWGKKENGARMRALAVAAAAAAAVAALWAPAVARADGVPGPLLAQAKANPSRTFDVIVQVTDGGADAADATVNAIAAGKRKASSWSSAARSSAAWTSASWTSAACISASWISASRSSATTGSSLALYDGAASDGDGAG